MESLREIADVKNNQLQIVLPEDFPSNQAEVIIFPYHLRNRINTRVELPELIKIEKENYASQIILEERG